MRKQFHPCGHSGLGQFCHRCKEADRLLALVEAKAKYVTFKDRPKDQGGPVTWTAEEVRTEVKRLREPAVRKNQGQGSVTDVNGI